MAIRPRIASIPTLPGWYWAVAVVALLWALAGCGAYLTQAGMDAEDLAALPQAQREIWQAMPAWVTAAYAVAVWSGLAGAIGLLLRKRWALWAYMLSLAGVVVQFGWTFLATPLLRSDGPGAAVFPMFIAAVGVVLIWFSRLAIARGWLR